MVEMQPRSLKYAQVCQAVIDSDGISDCAGTPVKMQLAE
jgi:hypothetical protein